MKTLMNGDVSKAELLRLPQNEEAPRKRARYTENQESEFEAATSRGNVNVNVLTSMPTPPLADNSALGIDQVVEGSASHVVSTRSSSTNSLTSLSENVQYIASSSPESDVLDTVAASKFPALRSEADRNCTDSPTFPPVTTALVKREQLDTLSSCRAVENSTSSGRAGRERWFRCGYNDVTETTRV